MTTTDIGRKGERIAARFLRRNGFRVLERNIHQSHNEIDIIALNREFILFVEVKTRTVDRESEGRFGTPGAAVDRKKQARLLQAARSYLVLLNLFQQQLPVKFQQIPVAPSPMPIQPVPTLSQPSLG